MTDFSHGGGAGYPSHSAQPQTYQRPDVSSPGRQSRFTIPRHPGEIPLLVITILFVLFVLVLVLVLAVLAYFGVQDKAAVDHGAIVIAHPSVTERLGAIAPFFFVMLTPLLVLFGRGVLWGIRRSQAIEITPTQFPQAYQMVVAAAQHYGLKRIPEAYVMSGNGSINANASGHGFRRFVTVYSDLFEVGGEARDPEALAFVIGHECGHISAGHTSYWRMLVFQIAQYCPPLQMALSRAQEYTADNHGYSVYPRGAMGTMRLLSGGKYLNHQVDVDAYADRAARDRGFFVWFVNFLASHPIGTWRAWALRDRSTAGKLFFAPKFTPGVFPPRSPQPAVPPPGTIPSVPVGHVALAAEAQSQSPTQQTHGRPEPTSQWAPPPHGQSPAPPA